MIATDDSRRMHQSASMSTRTFNTPNQLLFLTSRGFQPRKHEQSTTRLNHPGLKKNGDMARTHVKIFVIYSNYYVNIQICFLIMSENYTHTQDVTFISQVLATYALCRRMESHANASSSTAVQSRSGKSSEGSKPRSSRISSLRS